MYYIYLKFIQFQLTMASKQSDSANTTVVYSIMCMHKCYIYSTVLLFWRLFMLYVYT
jgi:hypothetical protein